MNIRHAIIGASALVLSAGAAAAQTIVIQPEQETVIREYIVENPAPVVEVPSDFTVEVGSTLPDIVEVEPVQVERLDGSYSYVVVNDRTLVVEPETRRIVHILN